VYRMMFSHVPPLRSATIAARTASRGDRMLPRGSTHRAFRQIRILPGDALALTFAHPVAGPDNREERLLQDAIRRWKRNIV
jgi:hypothetical protein